MQSQSKILQDASSLDESWQTSETEKGLQIVHFKIEVKHSRET